VNGWGDCLKNEANCIDQKNETETIEETSVAAQKI